MLTEPPTRPLAPGAPDLHRRSRRARHRSIRRSTRRPLLALANALFHVGWHGAVAAARLPARLALAARVQRERRALARLDDRELADIGLDRATAHEEAARRFLDLPAGRRR